MIEHSKRHALNKIATHDDGLRREHPGTLAEIAVTVPDEGRDQLIIRDWVDRRLVEIRNMEN
jgi:hypothetical protein